MELASVYKAMMTQLDLIKYLDTLKSRQLL